MITEQQKKSISKYRKKVYDNAPVIECACGCGALIKSKDKYGRDRKYKNGHNGRRHKDRKAAYRWWHHNSCDKVKKYQNGIARIHRLKISLIKSKGGRCKHCGIKYNGSNASIFDFHHINPEKKEFLINTNTLKNTSLARSLEEAKKCELLCANCHRLHHTGGW
jgi:hypothetical protein